MSQNGNKVKTATITSKNRKRVPAAKPQIDVEEKIAALPLKVAFRSR